MADLRLQGLTFEDIGTRVGCSERTARRYVGHIEPRIEPPGADAPIELDAEKLQVNLAKAFAELLMEGWNRWPSATFIAETNRLLRERLERTDLETLQLLARDQRIRSQFFLEVFAPIYGDFTACRHADEIFQRTSFTNKPFFWTPPHERKDLGDAPEDLAD